LETAAQRAFAIQQGLETRRSLHDTTWQDIAEFQMPSRALFTQRDPLYQSELNRRLRIVDNTAEDAITICADGIMSNYCPQSMRWFGLELPPEALNDNASRRWSSDALDVLYYLLNDPAAQFYQNIHMAIQDWVAFGNACVFRGERLDSGGVFFQTRHLAEIYIDENSHGLVDTFHRLILMPVRHIIDTWGIDKLPMGLRKAWLEGKEVPNEWVLHIVRPRSIAERYGGNYSLGPRTMPWASCYYLKCDMTELSEGGFRDLPISYARWSTRTGDPYGVGPGVRALPDVRMLNEIQRTMLKGAQKVVDPPLHVPSQGYLDPPRTFPGALNWFQGGTSDRITPLETKGRIDYGLQIAEKYQDKIKRVFYNDVFETTDDSNGVNVKATFTMSRRDDKFRRLSNPGQRLVSELLAPTIMWLYRYAVQSGKIDPPPPKIANAVLKLTYQSPIARAQRSGEVDDIQRLMELIAAPGQIDPSVWHNFNFDRLAQTGANRLLNVPAEIMNSQDEVDAKREEMAQQQEQTAALQAAPQIAGALKDVGAARQSLSAAANGSA
jgi:hypothetical protein